MATPGVASAAGSIGSALIGGLLGKGGDGLTAHDQLQMFRESMNWEYSRYHNDLKMQKEFAQNAAGWGMQDVIDTAKENGLHPLAALGQTGAQYSPISSGSPGIPGGGGGGNNGAFLGDKIGEAIESLLGDKHKQERKRDNAEIARIDAETELINQRSRSIIDAERKAATGGPTAPGTPSNAYQGGPPPKAPHSRRTPVQMPDGDTVAKLPASVARRLNLKPGDRMTAGDLAEILGEWSEVTSALSFNEYAKQMGIPMVGNPHTGGKKEKIKHNNKEFISP